MRGMVDRAATYKATAMSPISLRPTSVIIIAYAVFGLKMASARSNECSDEITRLEAFLNQPILNSAPKPMQLQSLDAQLHRQPTPESVRRAEQNAQFRLRSILAHAKSLDEDGRTSDCFQSIAYAKRVLGTN